MTVIDVLWLDDNIKNYIPYIFELEKHNFNVSTAATYEEAIEKTKRANFDIIISDIMMPPPDGIDFIEKASETQSKASFVILSDYLYNDIYRDRVNKLNLNKITIEKPLPMVESPNFFNDFVNPLLLLYQESIDQNEHKDTLLDVLKERILDFHIFKNSYPKHSTGSNRSDITWSLARIFSERDITIIDVGCGDGPLLEGLSALSNSQTNKIHYIGINIENVDSINNNIENNNLRDKFKHIETFQLEDALKKKLKGDFVFVIDVFNEVELYDLPNLIKFVLKATKINGKLEICEKQKLAKENSLPWGVDDFNKTDVGGVVLNVRNEESVKKEFHQLMEIENSEAVLLAQMASGTELFIGAKYEPRYGHVILCGLGGIYVEVMKDFSSGLAPLTMDEAMSMIKNLKSYKILKGYRGKKGVDINKFAEIIVRLSSLLRFAIEIKEMDINPLLGTGEDIFACGCKN